MVNGVISRRFPWALFIKNTEILCGFSRRCFVAVYPQEAGVERRHVLGEHLRRITLGIERHEKHLYSATVIAQALNHVGGISQGGRANIWTMGKAKKQQDRLP